MQITLERVYFRSKIAITIIRSAAVFENPVLRANYSSIGNIADWKVLHYMSANVAFFADVTLTLTRWPFVYKLDPLSSEEWRCRPTCRPKINSLQRQDFRKLSCYMHIHYTESIRTYLQNPPKILPRCFAGGNISIQLCSTTVCLYYHQRSSEVIFSADFVGMSVYRLCIMYACNRITFESLDSQYNLCMIIIAIVSEKGRPIISVGQAWFYVWQGEAIAPKPEPCSQIFGCSSVVCSSKTSKQLYRGGPFWRYRSGWFGSFGLCFEGDD